MLDQCFGSVLDPCVGSVCWISDVGSAASVLDLDCYDPRLKPDKCNEVCDQNDQYGARIDKQSS